VPDDVQMDDAVPLRQPLIEPPAVINVAEVDPAALTLPLDPYELSPQELFTISRARLTLLLDCLRNRGIQISTPEARPIPWSRHEQRYGLTDLDRAARFGYHVPEIMRRPPLREPPMPPEIADDCLALALRQLNHGVPDGWQPHLAHRLSMRTHLLSRQDSRVRAVFGSWSACMRAAGLDYPDPMAANNDPAFSTDEPTEQEIATAVADVRCKRAVGVIPVWAAVEAAYQKLVLDQHRDELELVRRALDIRLANARRAQQRPAGRTRPGPTGVEPTCR
jgi:hypothetical protein